jgi:hypothetical protein
VRWAIAGSPGSCPGAGEKKSGALHSNLKGAIWDLRRHGELARPGIAVPGNTGARDFVLAAGVAEGSCGPYSSEMSPLRARVQNGRIVLDEPTTLRDGTVIDLVADDEGDDLTDDERRALHEALSASMQSAEAGRLRSASAILDELRRKR